MARRTNETTRRFDEMSRGEMDTARGVSLAVLDAIHDSRGAMAATLGVNETSAGEIVAARGAVEAGGRQERAERETRETSRRKGAPHA